MYLKIIKIAKLEATILMSAYRSANIMRIRAQASFQKGIYTPRRGSEPSCPPRRANL